MGSFSLIHWVIVLLVIVLLFGSGRISSLMGDVAKGIKSFKKGMEDDEDEAPRARPVSRLEGRGADPQGDGGQREAESYRDNSRRS